MDTNIESIIFTKPKKNGDYFIAKAKDELIIQFPKMNIINIGPKNMELEFINDTSKYYKEVYNFLSNLDEHVIKYINENTESWFGKKIPLENVKQMYNKFIKAPKTSETKCTVNFIIKGHVEITDNKNNEIGFGDLVVGNTLECISQLKYIVFSKDSCFITWELMGAKMYIKKERVQGYGFIEDPSENTAEPVSDDEELFSFF